MTVAEDLKAALQRYDQAVRDEALSEVQADALFDEAEQLVPNARLSDLYFYGDRERSHDEVVQEALYREGLWEHEGERGVLLRMQAQAQAAMSNPNASITEKVISEQVLSGVQRELQELAGKLN